MMEDVQRLEDVWGENPYSRINQTEVDENAGVLFEPGEIITLKGGQFKIHSIGKKFIVLKPLAGTSWIKM